MFEDLIKEAAKVQPLKSQKGIYRNIFNLVQSGKIIDGDILEVGCWMGKTTVFLSKLFEDRRVFSVDPYTKVTMPKGHNKWDPDIYPHFVKHTKDLENHTHYRMTSDAAIKKFDERQIAFAFIDGDHSYEGVKKDFNGYISKMKVGGIIAFDDYKNTRWPGVGKAINEIKKDIRVKVLKSCAKEIYFEVVK